MCSCIFSAGRCTTRTDNITTIHTTFIYWLPILHLCLFRECTSTAGIQITAWAYLYLDILHIVRGFNKYLKRKWYLVHTMIHYDRYTVLDIVIEYSILKPVSNTAR